jgi:hypothetical protein
MKRRPQSDVAKAAAAAERQGLSVVSADVARGTVVVRGTAAQVTAAFNVELGRARKRDQDS